MSRTAKNLLQELIRTPSVNPAFAGNGDVPVGEAPLTEFLQALCERQGWPWLRQVVHPGRENLVVVLAAADPSAEVVLWECHQDTVGVTGMTIDPFAATESDGRIWGRGACDVKGSLAAMLDALLRVGTQDVPLPRTIVLALTINEECGFTGVKSLCRLWEDNTLATAEKVNTHGPLSWESLRALRPTRAIVAEPTELDVVVAHKGSVRWRCHTHGRAAHTSRPERGINAISAMAQVVQAIGRYQTDVLDSVEAHALCGGPTVCVSTIQGGTGVNTVPDHVVIDIDRRLVPSETADGAYQDLVAYVAQQVDGATIEHEPPSSQSVGLSDANNRDWAEHIAATAQSFGDPSRLIGVPFGTDAWALSALGIPTVVFGPGSIDQAHTEDEWIDIQQLERAVDIFYRLAVTAPR